MADRELFEKMKKKGECWRIIPTYPDYSVSTNGLVCRATRRRGAVVGKVLRPFLNDKGYKKVGLAKNGKKKTCSVHRLVLEAFVGDCPKGGVCNHKDGNKVNNSIENLEYCTPSENQKHAYGMELRIHPEQEGINNPNWRGGKTMFVCDACGKEFMRYASSYTGSKGRSTPKRKLCSKNCGGNNNGR